MYESKSDRVRESNCLKISKKERKLGDIDLLKIFSSQVVY